MARLQLITGMRPGEVCAMRGIDMDTSGELWLYRPAAHKTAHHGHEPERFALMIEAMARGDDAECDRLEAACPQKVYRCNDADFRDPMRRAYHISATVVLNMREGLVRIRMAEALRHHVPQLAVGPAKVAEVAFLYGREYGKWEAGAIEQIDLPEPEQLRTEVGANPDLKEQLEQLRQAVEECVGGVLDEVRGIVGTAHGGESLSLWEGLGRFSRETLGVEPLALVRAYGLQREDPAAEVRAAHPESSHDVAEAEKWAWERARSWAVRIPTVTAGPQG